MVAFLSVADALGARKQTKRIIWGAWRIREKFSVH
jgi:hypothetical protein